MTAALASDDALIDIRLLGPVELTGNRGSVPLGGPRLRTLFGLLALRAPDVVSRDALIDGIWDCTPPANAAKTLRAHVAYLRRGFTAGGLGELIATRPPGYALAVPASCVDARRFEDSVERGRTAYSTGAYEATVSHLRTALRMWRGDVLADCATGEWARAEATRLHEVRLCATEELLSAELTLGEHARLVAELESLVTRYPLRERLWELLMRALYRAGRQGEALRAYRRARAKLVEELGVEPGPQLRRLELAILAGDVEQPRVAAPRDARPPTTQALPEPDTAAVPAPLTNLVGRSGHIAELRRLVSTRRLVTITGVGGGGKTRLAIAVANELSARYADGVRFVDLNHVVEPELVPAAVAAVLAIPEDPSVDAVDGLVRALRTRSCLLVLDNCEQVVGACAYLVDTLLRSCPALRVLTTSRETLGVIGEEVWPVPALRTPPTPVAGGLGGIRAFSAARLFLDRAGPAARELTDADADAVAAVCAGLDGLPLAIELAAARTSVLTVREIADRLPDLSLLHAERHPDRPHHRALDATIAWSYDLLDPTSQRAFRRLAVFVGGFTLAAAEAVWRDADGRTTVDVLGDLVAKSLVVMQRRGDSARYRLLDTIHRWAADRLAEAPDEESEARAAHAAHYLALAEQADQRLRCDDVGDWLERLGVEHENLRAALQWYASRPAGRDRQLRLAMALERYCRLRGRYRDGRRWLEDAVARLGDEPSETLGRALAATAAFAFLVGDYQDAESWAEQALCVQRACGDHPGSARTLLLLGALARERGQYRRSRNRYAEALATPGLDHPSTADGLLLSGFTAWLGGDLDAAERLLGDALRRYQRLGDPENVASTHTHLAAVAFYRGRLARARWLADAALARFTELDQKEGIAWALNIRGLVELREGGAVTALATLRASLEVHLAVGDRWRQASLLEAMAAALVAQGEPTRAAELMGLAATLRDMLGVPVPGLERRAWLDTQAALRRALSDEERDAATSRGAAVQVPDILGP